MRHVTERSVEPVAPRADPRLLLGAERVDLAVAAMECPSCGNLIRNALLANSAVLEVQVDVPAALATVWYDACAITVSEIVAAVAVVGESSHHRFIATPVGRARDRRRDDSRPPG